MGTVYVYCLHELEAITSDRLSNWAMIYMKLTHIWVGAKVG